MDNDKKRWIFSGFSQKSYMEQLKKYIEELGGLTVDRENKYTFLCTHVVVKDFCATEKILAALAAGRWIVDHKYLIDSHRAGHWVDEKDYEIMFNEAVARHCRLMRKNRDAGLYSGWKYYVHLGNKNLTRSIRRIISAGDGDVLSEADLSKVDAVISERELVPELRTKLIPTVPIISSLYLKETLILKRNPSLLEKYMLDDKGVTYLVKTQNFEKSSTSVPCIVLEDDRSSSATKRSLREAGHSKKRSRPLNNMCPTTSTPKQTKLDQFFFKVVPSKKNVPLHSSQPPGLKHLVKEEPISSLDESGIEVLDEVQVDGKRGGRGKRSSDNADIVITKEGPSAVSRPRTRYSGIHIVKETVKSRKLKKDEEDCIITNVEKVQVKDEDCFITQVEKGPPSGIVDLSKGRSVKVEKMDLSQEKAPEEIVLSSPRSSTSKLQEQVHPSDNSEVVFSTSVSSGSKTSDHHSVCASVEADLPSVDTSDLPDISSGPEDLIDSRTSVDVSSRNDHEIIANRRVSSLIDKTTELCKPSENIAQVSSQGQRFMETIKAPSHFHGIKETAKHPSKVVDMKNKTAVSKSLEGNATGCILLKSDLYKLPEEGKKSIAPNATHILYSKKDMEMTIMKSICISKIMNRVSMSYSNHADCKLKEVHDEPESFVEDDDLTPMMHPSTMFQHSTSVRELTEREVSYYESATDRDTLNSKMGEVEKTIIIKGMSYLKLFITPYTYPPPRILGHVLQKLLFEATFDLLHSRAIDLTYSVLRYFPPLNLKMRKYYIDALKAAARFEDDFQDKLYLPWKFILRPITALEGSSSDPSDDSSVSSSHEGECSNLSYSHNLLEFIVALLCEDMKHPNPKELIREHLAWQIFWGQSQDPREITPPVKQLLHHWMSTKEEDIKLRFALGNLVAIVMELIWRCDRCLLLPITPFPSTFGHFADFLHHRTHGCDSESLMRLARNLPSPWSRSIFGSLIFLGEAQIKGQEFSLRDVMEFGLLMDDDANESASPQNNGTNIKSPRQELSPRKGLQKNINKKNPKGETKLMCACKRGNLGKVKDLLLVPGIDVNQEDNTGLTPLHEAAFGGHVSCMQALLEYDCLKSQDMKNTLHLYLRRAENYLCNVLAQSSKGYSALHEACRNNQLDAAKILLKYGGDQLLKLKTNKGETAMDLCQSDKMKKLLKRYEGKPPSKVSKNNRSTSRVSVLPSDLSKNHRFILKDDDRKIFIIGFMNDYLESTCLRFCRYFILKHSYNMFNYRQRQEGQSTDVSSSPGSTSSASSSKADEKDIASLSTLYESLKLSDPEMKLFNQTYDSVVSNLRLCREIIGVLRKSDNEPVLVTAMRNVFM